MSGYAMIAEGLKMMAAGYEQLADVSPAVSAPATKPEKPEKTAKKVADTPMQEAKKETAEPKADVATVRAAMRQKIKDGKMEACQDVLRSFGVEKLTDVPEEKLAELLAKVEVL